jgi:signal transduction histidine kinase
VDIENIVSEITYPGMEVNGYYKIEVQDTGIGISDVNQKKLFKTFGKLRDDQNLNDNGSGLGLTICKKIC